LSFADIFDVRKPESLGYLSRDVVRVILRLVVSVKHGLVTDRQTDRQTTTVYTALAWHRAVKKLFE